MTKSQSPKNVAEKVPEGIHGKSLAMIPLDESYATIPLMEPCKMKQFFTIF